MLARTMNSLADLSRGTGGLELGRSTAERAIALQEETLGSDHPDPIGSLVNLARIEREMGELTAARGHLERALEIGDARLDRTDRRLRQGEANSSRCTSCWMSRGRRPRCCAAVRWVSRASRQARAPIGPWAVLGFSLSPALTRFVHQICPVSKLMVAAFRDI